MVVWYLVTSLDPDLLVAVAWEPVLGSFLARVEGVPTRALLDPDHLTVIWFGSRQGELQTVEDLQEAIGDYAVLKSDIRSALEADRTGRGPAEPTDLARQLPWEGCSWCRRTAPLGPRTSGRRSVPEGRWSAWP